MEIRNLLEIMAPQGEQSAQLPPLLPPQFLPQPQPNSLVQSLEQRVVQQPQAEPAATLQDMSSQYPPCYKCGQNIQVGANGKCNLATVTWARTGDRRGQPYHRHCPAQHHRPWQKSGSPVQQKQAGKGSPRCL